MSDDEALFDGFEEGASGRSDVNMTDAREESNPMKKVLLL